MLSKKTFILKIYLFRLYEPTLREKFTEEEIEIKDEFEGGDNPYPENDDIGHDFDQIIVNYSNFYSKNNKSFWRF